MTVFTGVGCNSTLKDKIEIMQAALNGIPIQYCAKPVRGWYDAGTPAWDWTDTQILYRIKPKEPREFYVVMLDNVVLKAYSKENFNSDERNYYPTHTIIKVREIIEDASSVTEEG